MPASDEQPTVLSRLLEAKRHSDRRDYRSKVQILRELIRQDPTSFKIDSELPGGIVGLTHSSGFRIHAPKVSLPGEVSLEPLSPDTDTDLSEERRKWAVRPPLEALVDSHGDRALDLKKAAARLPLSSLGIYYHPTTGGVHVFPGQDPEDILSVVPRLEKAGFVVEAHRDGGSPESLYEETWVTIKRAYSPALRAVTDLTGFTPGPVNKWYGGPNPIAGTLLGGLAGAGLGYGAGALSEAVANATGYKILKGRRLRKTLGLIGGLAGAAPGAFWGYHNVRSQGLGGLVSSHPGINDDPNSLPTTDEPIPGGVKTGSFRDPEEGAITEPLLFLETHLPEHLRPRFSLKIAAFGDAGSELLERVNVDAFGRAIWSPDDPFTPPDIRAAATGLVDAASMYQGGSSLVSPLDIGRVAVGMGSGLVSGMVVGKVLGALAGLSPGAQKTLQQAGTWYGALKAVVPGVFGR